MIGEISFCDKKGFNIKTDETKKYILERLESKYHLKIITKHFEKYAEAMLPNIKKRPHMLCVRSNGNPYFLYLVKLNFTNYCIFIDKKIQQGYAYPRMIITHFKFDDVLFRDTIFDGEMVKTMDGYWMFLINDVLVYQGQHMHDTNLIKRLNILYECLDKNLNVDQDDICRIAVKKYFHCTEGEHIINNHINNVNYTCRGLYFKPLFLRFKDILINFDDNLIKKVERQKYKNFKSFMLIEDQDKIDHVPNIEQEKIKSSMLDCDNDNDLLLATKKTNLPDVYEICEKKTYACIPSLKISKYMRELFSNKNIVDTVMIQYYKDPTFNFKLVPLIE